MSSPSTTTRALDRPAGSPAIPGNQVALLVDVEAQLGRLDRDLGVHGVAVNPIQHGLMVLGDPLGLRRLPDVLPEIREDRPDPGGGPMERSPA